MKRATTNGFPGNPDDPPQPIVVRGGPLKIAHVCVTLMLLPMTLGVAGADTEPLGDTTSTTWFVQSGTDGATADDGGASFCEFDPVAAYCTTGEHPPSDRILHGVGVTGLGVVIGDFQSQVRGLETGRIAFYTCSAYSVGPVFDVVCNGDVVGGFPYGEPYVHECFAAPFGTMDPTQPAEAGMPGFVATPLGILCAHL